MLRRLSRLAPEEIVGAILLGVALIAVALQPQAVGRIFESPYATPAPESGAATFIGDARRSPEAAVPPQGQPAVLHLSPGRPPASLRRETPAEFVIGVADPCWEAAAAALRAGGQGTVVCVPTITPIVAPRMR